MKFKTPDLAAQLDSRHPLLIEMAYKFDKLSNDFGIDPVVTRILGKIEGDSGVHNAGRAIDFRDEVGEKSTYTFKMVEELLQKMNDIYSRSDGRCTLKHHSFMGGPMHFHLQLAPRLTVYPEAIRIFYRNIPIL